MNCISYGGDAFVRFWPHGEWEPGDAVEDMARATWRSYQLENKASTYFIGNLVDTLCGVDNQQSDFGWFTHHGGKRPNMQKEVLLSQCASSD